MTGYTKLFGSIIASTIWRESKETKIVWITMLAMANKTGLVEASVPGLAHFAQVSVAECEAALNCLLEPDPYSRTKEHEGRRIEAVDGGWRLLNHAKYRAKMSADDRREYLRLKQQEHRKKPVNTASTPVNKCSGASTPSTHAEAEAEAEAIKKREGSPPLAAVAAHSLPPEAAQWNQVCGSKLPKVMAASTKRQRCLSLRRKDLFWVGNFSAALGIIMHTPFLLGENNRGWTATFDWMIERPDTVAKIMEGNYGNNGHTTTAQQIQDERLLKEMGL